MNQPLTDTKASAQRASALRFDIVAGLTAAAVVLPKAMAYATVAGLPVAVGLYTAFVPMGVYALLGSSRWRDCCVWGSSLTSFPRRC
jgi:SulP family sulfate permease